MPRYVKFKCRGHCDIDFPKYDLDNKIRYKLRAVDYEVGWTWCRTCEKGIPPLLAEQSNFCPCCHRKFQFKSNYMKYRESFVTRY